MAKCGECTYYHPVSPVSAGAGWCHCDAMQVAVVADLEACKNFERRTSMDEKRTEAITIELWRYTSLVRKEERLEIARAILAKADFYESEKLKLLKSVLLEKEPCTTPTTT
jgi:hypothetical protein